MMCFAIHFHSKSLSGAFSQSVVLMINNNNERSFSSCTKLAKIFHIQNSIKKKPEQTKRTLISQN